jgi:DNA-binding NarL/FixJ family response regulator
VPDHERDIIPCLESGAAGYIPTDASVDDLVHIVTAVANGNAWCSDRFAAFLFSRIRDFANGKWPDAREDALLTAREFEVIELLAEGLSNKEIAGRLNIETQTVKNHVHHLLEKLSVHKRMDAVAYARQRHWLRR